MSWLMSTNSVLCMSDGSTLGGGEPAGRGLSSFATSAGRPSSTVQRDKPFSRGMVSFGERRVEGKGVASSGRGESRGGGAGELRRGHKVSIVHSIVHIEDQQ